MNILAKIFYFPGGGIDSEIFVKKGRNMAFLLFSGEEERRNKVIGEVNIGKIG